MQKPTESIIDFIEVIRGKEYKGNLGNDLSLVVNTAHMLHN